MVEMILKKTLFRVSTQTKLWICIHALGGSCSFWIQANLHHSDKLFDIGYVDKSEFDETTSEYLHNIYFEMNWFAIGKTGQHTSINSSYIHQHLFNKFYAIS